MGKRREAEPPSSSIGNYSCSRGLGGMQGRYDMLGFTSERGLR
jgi:hypothetical protein